LREQLAAYRTPSVLRSSWQLVSTLALYAGTWFLLLRVVAAGWPVLWTVPLVLLAATCLVRLFILQHDLGHGAMFRSANLQAILGSFLGVLTLTPFFRWRRTHAMHHATSGKLDERRPDRDIFTFTVREYRGAKRLSRWAYRAFRHPLFMFGVLPSLVFLVEQRFALGPGVGWKERWSVRFTNVAVALWLWGMHSLVGLGTYLPWFLAMFAVGGAAGIWLFYVQHQFPEAYWRSREDWSFEDAALLGSTHYKLPWLLQWGSANIGLHHVHHLDTRIPNYRLQACHEAIPELQRAPTLGLWEAMRVTPVDLWDEEQGRMVRFREVA
jgi:acyl-lipid omega-6 desaturase (Delta-12 desaturase)